MQGNACKSSEIECIKVARKADVIVIMSELQMILMVPTGVEHGMWQGRFLQIANSIVAGLEWSGPVTLKLESKLNPEPDVIGWKGGLPEVVVEISDTTLKTDLGTKKDIYQEEGIHHYVVIDVRGRKAYAFRLKDGVYVEDEELRGAVFNALKEAFEA
jgi:Uma2 family endonuclease